MFNAPEDEVRKNTRIPALNIEQDLLVSKILPTKIMACPNCGRQDPTGYEAKRNYDFQIILLKSVKRMFAYLAIMVSVAVPTFLLIFSK